MPVDTISWIKSGTEDRQDGLNVELTKHQKRRSWNVNIKKAILGNQWNVNLKKCKNTR